MMLLGLDLDRKEIRLEVLLSAVFASGQSVAETKSIMSSMLLFRIMPIMSLYVIEACTQTLLGREAVDYVIMSWNHVDYADVVMIGNKLC